MGRSWYGRPGQRRPVQGAWFSSWTTSVAATAAGDRASVIRWNVGDDSPAVLAPPPPERVTEFFEFLGAEPPPASTRRRPGRFMTLHEQIADMLGRHGADSPNARVTRSAARTWTGWRGGCWLGCLDLPGVIQAGGRVHGTPNGRFGSTRPQ